jgi:hypothetical protein
MQVREIMMAKKIKEKMKEKMHEKKEHMSKKAKCAKKHDCGCK